MSDTDGAGKVQVETLKRTANAAAIAVRRKDTYRIKEELSLTGGKPNIGLSLIHIYWGNDYLADNEAVIIQKLKDGGTVITELTEEQKAEFQKACAGIYDDYAKSVGQEVIDLFTGGYKN